ncbi:hypothetical protein J6590_046126 [Homalodisca vitripennis]|nr:hypothetical protein J6590_046126 [Homalodisca vitripennis]
MLEQTDIGLCGMKGDAPMFVVEPARGLLFSVMNDLRCQNTTCSSPPFCGGMFTVHCPSTCSDPQSNYPDCGELQCSVELDQERLVQSVVECSLYTVLARALTRSQTIQIAVSCSAV